MEPLDTHDPLVLRHSARRAKFWKELARNNPPPFLGPLVSIKEVMQALERSEFYVRARIEDGRLNVWKDPVSKRIWILKDDLDLLLGDNNALQAKRQSRPTRKPKPNAPTTQRPHDLSEDLDAIGGWEAPKPPESAALLQEWQRESDAKYQQAQRENEEWYAAELAKLEGRDPEAAVRQLQIERGWLTPQPAPLPSPGRRGAGGEVRPISWSNPNPRPRQKPEPYLDPDTITSSPHHIITSSPHQAIIPPFPMGWINKHEAAKVVQVTPRHFNKIARKQGLQRRKLPGTREYLYDSLEVEQFAERRLDKSCEVTVPGKRLNWWGSRAAPVELREFDYWITTAEAGQILGVSPNRIGRMCDKGLFPCKQERPGVTGSRIYVPHCAVYLLSQRGDYQKRRQIQAAASRSSSRTAGGNEEWDVEPFDPSQPSPATRISHGEYLTTRQTALALGVGIASVNRLRLRGRLPATQLHAKKRGSAKNPWWFFRRDDVDNLLGDPEYRKRAAKGKKAQYGG